METIELKKERLENLKQSDLKLTNDIMSIKENVKIKMTTYNDIKNCLESTEKSYDVKCKDIKQNMNIELEKNSKRLENDTKEISKHK